MTQPTVTPHDNAPVIVRLNVDQILTERTTAWDSYDDDFQELARRADQRSAADDRRLQALRATAMWTYVRDDQGTWTATDAAAPLWTLAAWRESAIADGTPPDDLAAIERLMHEDPPIGVDTAYITRSATHAVQLRQLEDQESARGIEEERIEQALEAQRQAEWAAYGAALESHILAAADMQRLVVDVQMVYDVGQDPDDAVEAQPVVQTGLSSEELITAAVRATPSPADLPGTPLSRLETPTTE